MSKEDLPHCMGFYTLDAIEITQQFQHQPLLLAADMNTAHFRFAGRPHRGLKEKTVAYLLLRIAVKGLAWVVQLIKIFTIQKYFIKIG